MKKIKLTISAFLFFAFGAKAQGYIEFTENKGQWDKAILFDATIGNGKVALTKTGYKILQYDANDYAKYGGHNHQHDNEKKMVKGHVWNVNFIGANPNFKVVSTKPLEGISNYFLGNDPSKWASGCKTYTTVKYENVYDNIDVQFYTSNQTLKYDIIVKPGGDVNKIKLQYEGVDKLSKGKNEELLVETSVGKFKELAPYTYQLQDFAKKTISSGYKLDGNLLTFRLAAFDPKQTLVIDPTLIFSTHSGSTSDNWGFTATYGPDETFYGGGDVRANGFPVTAGAFQGSFGNGETDIAIIKLNQNGTSRIYATYIGGSGAEQPHSLICDPQGNLIIAGRSNSPNFPRTAPVFGAGGGYDIFITKLNATGTALIGSIEIGGNGDDGVNIETTRSARNSLQYNYGDDGRSEVNIDASGNIVLASCSRSNNFFTTPGALQSTFGGSQDAVFVKTNPNLSNIIFSTYFGGSGDDAAYVVNVKPDDGNIYFAGGTGSANLPGNSAGTVQPANAGGIDGFIAEVNPSGTAILKTTYIGTPQHDQIYGIQFDKFNFPYIMGISLGNWPVINSAYSNAGSHQFIAKLEKDLSAYIYTTKFGTSSSQTNISPVAFLVDRCENVYVSGWGGSLGGNGYSNAGTNGMPVTTDALDPTTDGRDFYYFVLEKNGASQLFGSFFGGTQSAAQLSEHVDGGTSRFDPKGAIYQAACASCGGLQSNNSTSPGYPGTTGSWSQNNRSSNCNLGMTKIRFNLTGVGADLRASDTTGCMPLTVDFSDAFLNAVSYEFNFGDGSPTIATANTNITHTFSTPGIFRVRMIAIDLNSCNLRDTSYKTIRVRNDRATVSFVSSKQPPCDNLTYFYTNTSVAPPGKPFSNNSFTWDFGDNTGVPNAGTAQQTKTYATAGTYTVSLLLKDTNYCNAPFRKDTLLRLSPFVKADFALNNGCQPFTTTFTNNSQAGSTFEWTFGDGGVSTANSPSNTYNTPGTYTVRLVANDPNTCNFTDTMRKSITIFPKPNADFSFSPTIPITNTPTQFTNLSTDANRYRWIFGDGDSSTLTNPLHQFVKTGSFNTCLYASNQFGCLDTICKTVEAIVEPLIDVPNAFTPNGDGLNDFVIPRSFGIQTIQFRVFNRWGQMIFETNQRNVGWDGKYKGQLQPLEVYSYTLNAVFFDGQKVSRSGSITLLK